MGEKPTVETVKTPLDDIATIAKGDTDSGVVLKAFNGESDHDGGGSGSGGVMPSGIRKGIVWKLNPNKAQSRLNPLGPWKRRWVALDAEHFQMRYYDSTMVLRGTIDLRLASKVEPLNGDRKVRGMFAFAVRSNVNPRMFTLGFPTKQERDSWCEHVKTIVDVMPPVAQLLLEQFCRADKDKSFTLEFSEVRALLAERKVQVSTAAMRQKFEEVDLDHNESLDFSEFERLVFNLRRDDHAARLFDRWVGRAAKYMTLPVLVSFLRDCQHDPDPSPEKCRAIIARHKPEEAGAPVDALDIWGFTDWLTNPEENGPTSADKAMRVYQDTTRPMSHYFIAASAHTYLLSDSVKGASSAEAYAVVLRKGARYIEVDVWDGPGGNPVVCFSGSMFQKIQLVAVLQKIRQNAFISSQLPVIVSVNCHCSAQQQDIVAARIKDTFGDYLYPVFRTEELPSPRALFGKIVLKMKIISEAERGTSDSSSSIGKKGSTHSHGRVSTAGSTVLGLIRGKKTKKGAPAAVLGTASASAAAPGTPPLPESAGGAAASSPLGSPPRGSSPAGDASSLAASSSMKVAGPATARVTEEVSEGNSSDEETAISRRAVSKHQSDATIPVLASLVHFEGTRFHGARVDPSDGTRRIGAPDTPCWKVCSLSDEKQRQAVDRNFLHALQQYTSSHLVKVYPRGGDASYTYDPASVWCSGCQLAAVNYHATSEAVWVNEAKFLDNGQCGYVLKPDWLIAGLPPSENGVRLVVKVISARQLPQIEQEVIDPYVSVCIKGWHDDCTVQRTKAIPNNGWDPTWDTEFIFDLHAPELDVICFTVYDRDSTTQDDFVAQCTVSFPMLRLGVRSLPLCNGKMRLITGAHLLCEFQTDSLSP